MRKGPETGVNLDVQQIMQMSIKLEKRNNVDMAFAAVRNDSVDLVFGEPTLWIQQRIAVEFNRAFAVDVILIRFPAGEEVELPLDFVLGGQRPVAHVDHSAPVSKARPVADF